MDKLDHLIKEAFNEDLDKLGDITTLGLYDDTTIAEGTFISNAKGVLSGMEIASRCFYLYDHSVVFRPLKQDGDHFNKGQTIASIKGKIRSLLAVERTALNFVMHLSGIATLTQTFTQEINDTACRLKDTRKTTPGLRQVEKKAVIHGGGFNHRQGLYDGILIKDNHLKGTTITDSIKLTRAKYPNTEVEVEVDTYDQAIEAMTAGADIILLDNMDEDTIRQIVQVNHGKAQLEASGGITLDNVRKIADTGINFVSTSAITMAARPIDVTFELTR